MSSSLKVKDLCKTYVMDKRQNNVLKNVSFSVSREKWWQLWDQAAPENQLCFMQ